jgi:uncharacterized membrane protein
MITCPICGATVPDNVKFCPKCGTPLGQQQAAGSSSSGTDNRQASSAAAVDAEQNKVMALLSYFGILVIIPILAAGSSPFARFHANQGIVLLIAMIGYAIVDAILTAVFRAIFWSGLEMWSIYSMLSTVLNLVYIVFTVLAIIGIINALNGRMQELPVIGKFRILK